ncbi:hypothetical protein V5O48_018667, partial [Marasmius crinis-equi]
PPNLPNVERPAVWPALVYKWVELQEKWEHDKIKDAVFTTVNRIPAMRTWFNNGRVDRKPGLITQKAVVLEKIRNEWWTWWDYVNPDWRPRLDGMVLPRDDGDWEDLVSPGKDGIVLFLVGLRWWSVCGSPEDAAGCWHKAAKSLYFTMESLLKRITLPEPEPETDTEDASTAGKFTSAAWTNSLPPSTPPLGSQDLFSQSSTSSLPSLSQDHSTHSPPPPNYTLSDAAAALQTFQPQLSSLPSFPGSHNPPPTLISAARTNVEQSWPALQAPIPQCPFGTPFLTLPPFYVQTIPSGAGPVLPEQPKIPAPMATFLNLNSPLPSFSLPPMSPGLEAYNILSFDLSASITMAWSLVENPKVWDRH